MLTGAINYNLSLGYALVSPARRLGLVAMVHTSRNLSACASCRAGRSLFLPASAPSSCWSWKTTPAIRGVRLEFAFATQTDRTLENPRVNLPPGALTPLSIPCLAAQPRSPRPRAHHPGQRFPAWAVSRLELPAAATVPSGISQTTTYRCRHQPPPGTAASDSASTGRTISARCACIRPTIRRATSPGKPSPATLTAAPCWSSNLPVAQRKI